MDQYDRLVGVVMLVVGSVAVFFNRWFVRVSMENARRTWGYGEFTNGEVIGFRLVTFFGGAGLLLMGAGLLLGMLGNQ